MKTSVRVVPVMILVWAIVGNSALEVKAFAGSGLSPVVSSDPASPGDEGIETLLDLLRLLCGPIFCTSMSVEGSPEIDAFIASYRANGVNPNLTAAERRAAIGTVDLIEQSIPASLPAAQRDSLIDALEDIVRDLQS